MSNFKERYKDFLAQFEKGQLLGLDIGMSAVKLALLSSPKKNVYRLEKFISVPLSEASIIEDEVQKPEEIIEAIKLALEEGKIKTKIACLGMHGPNTVTKRLQVPDGPRDEIEDNIMWESEQYIPFGADESEIGFHILGKIEEDDVVDTVVGAVKSEVAQKYSSYLVEAGLVPKVIDLSVFAIINTFEYIYDDRIEDISQEGAIILDFGAQKTTIIVYKQGGPILTKEINLGGVLVTEEIQRSMGISYEEAEDLKVYGDENGNVPEELLGIIENHIVKILEELKKVLNFYIAVGSSDQVGYCFVTGGSSRLPGIIESIQELTGVEVEEINPFEALEIKEKYTDAELDDIATCGLVSLGLGMRKI